MPPERLKDDRALSTIPAPARSLYLVTDQDDPRERPTDPVGSAPPESAGAAAPMQAIPPPALPSETASVETWEGYDEKSFMHRAIAAVIDGTNALLTAKQTQDIEAILQRQRVLFEDAIGPKLDTIAGRVTKTEERLNGLDELRREFEALKTRMTELERRIGKEGTNAAEAQPPATG